MLLLDLEKRIGRILLLRWRGFYCGGMSESVCESVLLLLLLRKAAVLLRESVLYSIKLITAATKGILTGGHSRWLLPEYISV